MNCSTNPWLDVPDVPPFVAPVDAPVLTEFAARLLSRWALKLDLMPQPWTGSIHTASVILLTLNPGFSERDYEELRDPDYREQWRRALSFDTRTPFYFLDPAFRHTSGYEYWYRRLKDVIDVAGLDAVSSKIMCIEHFPYKSMYYKPLGVTLPSQNYSFALVRDAIRLGKPIIVMRSERLWRESVAELATCEYIRLSNNQNPYLSRRQTTAAEFERVLAALRN